MHRLSKLVMLLAAMVISFSLCAAQVSSNQPATGSTLQTQTAKVTQTKKAKKAKKAKKSKKHKKYSKSKKSGAKK